jgi:O-antigen ligase
MREPERLAISRVLGLVALITTLVVTPWASYDPINAPKLAVVAVGGAISLVFLLLHCRELFAGDNRLVAIVSAVFIIDLVIVLFLSGTNFNQEFFGTVGRLTGFVAYVSLASLLLMGVISASIDVLHYLSKVFLITGGISIVYGLIQAGGMDPVKWSNPYSPVIGFSGNPNFQSSLVAFSAVMALALLFSSQSKIYSKIGLALFIFLAIYVISQTDSQQGYFVLVIGIAVIGLVFVYKSKLKALTPSLIVTGLIGLIFVIMGSLNSGPLASILHKASVIYRGDYWLAGWRMTVEHPVFGVGLDSYGDWYRRSRTLEASVRRGPDLTSNAAHNVLLDFSSTGGFPLLIIYLLLMVLVIRAALKVLKRAPKFEPTFVGLVAVWVGYQGQSLISLNQLGLAVWGWIISGLIIGYEINTRRANEVVKTPMVLKKGKVSASTAQQKVLPSTTVALFIGILVGLVAGLPPLLASSKYKSAIESGDPKVYASAADYFPQDFARAVQISQTLENNGYKNEALSVIQRASEAFPDSYEVWKVYSLLSTATPAQVSVAKAQMKRLDPNNPELK